ncbi:IS5 family transposase [Fontivita pretiosa]|uniref:IS5 family transposase n=1 Tax=Fontivita pretiosa TaxID=2989684 RepID=UPI003D173405
MPVELWKKIEVLIDKYNPPKKTGRKRTSERAALDGILYRMRTGCQWNALPGEFGDDCSVHRASQRWVRCGLFEQLWALLLSECEELGGVDWKWQSADAVMGKARHGGTGVGPNPTDRGKDGTKRSVLTEADGGPLAVVVAGANVHDAKLLAETIEAVVVEQPGPEQVPEQHLCLDKGYDNPSGQSAAEAGGYVPHIRRIGQEKPDERKRKRRKARRWVVQRTIVWLNRCRGILVRYEKKAANYLGVVQLACALLWYRRLHRLKAAPAF